MNSSVSARGSNLKFFFGALGLSIVMVAASGFFIKSLLSGNSGAVPESVKSCLTTMRTNGFNPDTRKVGEISVILATTNGIETLVNKSGVIIASCPAYTLNDYCAGAGCPTPGVTFTLKHKEL